MPYSTLTQATGWSKNIRPKELLLRCWHGYLYGPTSTRCLWHPIICAWVKSITVYPSHTGLPGLSWNKAIYTKQHCKRQTWSLIFGHTIQVKNQSSINIGPIILTRPMTLTFNPLRAMVMTYSHAKVQSQRFRTTSLLLLLQPLYDPLSGTIQVSR